jgi:tRNA (guanine37-N1)-methyltransferase
MKIDILTIFPDMFKFVFTESIIKRAINARKVEIETHDLRKWTHDSYKTVDDHPFGGGAGMILKIEPIYEALEELDANWKAYRILFTAKGARIVQEKVRELSKKNHLIFICGHYEGVDERVHKHLVDECISLGDFVLTGGEIPAMALVDSVVRLIPGVLGNEESVVDESFSQTEDGKQYLEYPQYTRPAEFKTKDGKVLKVPEVLLTGNHEKIKEWREGNRKLVGI